MFLNAQGLVNRKINPEIETDIIIMNNIYLPEMECEIRPYYRVKGKKILPFWVQLEKID